MFFRLIGFLLVGLVGFAQSGGELKQRPEAPANGLSVPPGTHILLSMINTVSSKRAQVGDRIYLETAFPVVANGRILVPQGSWVTGTVTQVIRAARMRGKGGLQVRFDSLTLPNGVSRSFNANPGSSDMRDGQGGSKGGDALIVASTAGTGAAIGSTIGVVRGAPGMGAGVGAGVGAAAGLVGVLLAHGPDAVLSRGATVEMVLDRPLTYEESDLDFRNVPLHSPLGQGSAPTPASRKNIPFSR